MARQVSFDRNVIADNANGHQSFYHIFQEAGIAQKINAV